MSKEEKILFNLNELKTLMIKEKGENWLSGINSIIYYIENDNFSFEERIKNARDQYLSMNRPGHGSFSEFHIWRNDFKQRIKENKKLDKIKKTIEKELKIKY